MEDCERDNEMVDCETDNERGDGRRNEIVYGERDMRWEMYDG